MSTQPTLFNLEEGDETPILPDRMGRARIGVLEKTHILTPATGFISDYDFTLNPYNGCQFGCAYCYAAFFVSSRSRREDWGQWVDVKANAVQQIKRSRSLPGKTVYISSVTDPYQPLEARIQLTQDILRALVEIHPQPRLVIQTRSPLVTRDLDILRQFKHLRVNMTVTTDSEPVRKRFEPFCPSNERRLAAIAEVRAADIKTGICVTPMLPLRDAEQFGQRLAAMKADVYVAQPFKPSQGPFAASTRSMALEIAREYGWTESRYREAFTILRNYLPDLYEGRAGFMPE